MVIFFKETREIIRFCFLSDGRVSVSVFVGVWFLWSRGVAVVLGLFFSCLCVGTFRVGSF